MSLDNSLAPVQNSGKGVQEGKDPLPDEFWSTAPEFLHKMRNNAANPQAAKQFIEQVARELYMTPREQRKYLRPNAMSHAYRANYEELKRSNIKLNASGGLTIEQILAIDRHFHRTYVNNNVAAQMLGSVTTYLNQKSWESKHHKLENYEWPRFTKDFRGLGEVNVGPELVKSSGMGWGAHFKCFA